jgi:hypothetical protein
MRSDYEAICAENRLRYGTQGAQKSGGLAAGLYEDRTHFIFELLQNAEDAIGRHPSGVGPRTVMFELSGERLRISHFGKPFDTPDVRSVCDIAESTKDEFSIGRHGLGFKSVYAITDRPEIHSGDESFAIDEYVFPKQVQPVTREAEETKIVLPLRRGDDKAQTDIATGFRHLGATSLLFLRHIDEIGWSVADGGSGVYLRSAPRSLGPNVRQITVIGQESGKPEIDENWLVFHRDVFSPGGVQVGRVECAFELDAIEGAPGRWSIRRVATSPLVVFFPTVLSTHLGFLVQGPYLTTPSRESIKSGEPWNLHLVQETASLVLDALRWMRDNDFLDTAALRCLPLDRSKFPEGAMFAPIFEAVRTAMLTEPLLPRFDGGFVSAAEAKLARTQELRQLFEPHQVAELFDSQASAWLTGDITADREPEIRQYLLHELNVTEVTPATAIPRLSQSFLQAQSDEWISRLYEFLNGQGAALRRVMDSIPLVRLEDGTHVVAREDGKPKAFLPSDIETDFPVVRRSVCSSTESRAFLVSLGITEPDPVDDVIWTVLPRYREERVDVDDATYAADIARILAAFRTDSMVQRVKLIAALRASSFVMVVDTGDGEGYVSKPQDIYIATERLKQLFAEVPGIFIVDDSYDCLRGEAVRDLLEACGALRYLRPEEVPNALSHEEKRELRRRTGYADTSGINDRVVDWALQGMDSLIEYLPTLSPEMRSERARLIWESLGDLEERRGRGVFEGAYTWTHRGERKTPPFPAAFLRNLTNSAWVPDANGELVRPELVVFETLGWKPNPFLLSKLAFKPQIIDQLAKAAGIDPAALDLLRRLGITSVADLTNRLGINDTPPKVDELSNPPAAPAAPDPDVYDTAKDLYGDDMPEIPDGTLDPDGGDGVQGAVASGRAGQRDSAGGGQRSGSSGGSGAGADGSATGNPRGKSPGGHGSERVFISYVGVHAEDEEPDPDALTHPERMRIEDQAIGLIVSLEPRLQRTSEGNAGFDLFEGPSLAQAVRWVEVKAMTRGLADRPVGMSHTQFDWAREKRHAYWLYVVEHASDPTRARVLRIQDPAGRARTFVFDRGWMEVARQTPLP